MSLFFITQEIVSQLTEVLVAMPKESYSKPIEILSSASIGQHVRHVSEFYQCILDGVASGIVDYDKRKRDLRLEEELTFAISNLNSICTRLKKIQNRKELHLAYYGMEDEDRELIPTSFERELAYNIEHMIHHMALIRIGVKCIMPNYLFHENFGVAASTIKYRRQNVHSKLSA